MIETLKDIWDRMTNQVIKTTDLAMSTTQTLVAFKDTAVEITSQFSILLEQTNLDYYKEAKKIGYDVKSNKELAKVLMDDCDTIISATEEVIERIEDLPKILTNTSITIKQMTILEITKKLESLMFVFPRLEMYIMYKVSGDKKLLYKSGYEDILRTAVLYHDVIKDFKSKSTIFKDVDGLSSVMLRGEVSEIKAIASKNDTRFNYGKNKFITSWIYNIGKLSVDMDIAKIERLKDSKKLMELKILELQETETSGGVSTQISKQIEYYENKITKLDRNIEELSNVED